MTKRYTEMIGTSLAQNGLSAEEARMAMDQAPLLDLCAAARLVASDRPTFTCGIVNAKSGQCAENCRFCAQSIHYHTDVATHPLIGEDEMVRRAEGLADSGAEYMGMVTSGTAPGPRDFERLCGMATRIRERVPIKLCASLGLVDREQATTLKQAGFTSYHHNLETSRSYYPEICTSHPFELRAETVRVAKAAGLRVCSGGLFGLGETWAQRLELAAILVELDVDCIPVNFLHPIDGTPLAHLAPPSPGTALAIIAALRLMHPRRDIVICGGRGASLGRFESMVFAAGANGIMVGDYLTTSGGPLDDDVAMLETLTKWRRKKTAE